MGSFCISETQSKLVTFKTIISNFSWHEIGTIDLPAIIDYILRQTGHQKLFYIGHNQGVTAVLALLADKPKYNRKIHTVAGMAPLTFLGNGIESGIAQNLVKFNDQLWVC